MISGDLSQFDLPAVIFVPEFESDGRKGIGHVVYRAFQGQAEVTGMQEYVSDPNCQTAFSVTRPRT